MDTWPFSEPQNVATITVKQLVHDGHPVLVVVHDEEDGDRQFLTGGTLSVADGLAVSLAFGVRRALDPWLDAVSTT